MHFVVVYDACVLYPAPLRDFLMHLATAGLFAARWSRDIQMEWSRSLLHDRPELGDVIPRTVELMNQAILDCLVTGYQELVPALKLPDPDDRHVLAAAIVAGAQSIVTFNLKDFPADAIDKFGIEAVHPDTFAVQQLDLHAARVVAAARNHRRTLRHPPKGVDPYLETLASQGLVVTAERLRSYRDLL